MKSFCPELSIISVVLNDLQGIMRTFESSQSQESGDFEWVVIDGFSNDGTYEFLQRATQTLSVRVTIIQKPPKGIYDAMNYGYVESAGSWCWFLNAGDTLISKKAVSKALSDIKKSSDAKLIAYPVIQVTKLGFLYDCVVPKVHSINGSFVAQMNHQGVLLARNALESIGGFDSRLKYAADGKLLDSMVMKFGYLLSNRAMVFFFLGGRSLQNTSKTLKEIATYRTLYSWRLSSFSLIFRAYLRRMLLLSELFPMVRVLAGVYLVFRQNKVRKSLSYSEIEFNQTTVGFWEIFFPKVNSYRV